MKKHVYCRHSHELEVPFFDVDAMHIVWHGNYVKYLEVARCAFLAGIGYDYNEMARQGYGWPIVKMDFKYVRPAQFGQRIRVDMAIVEITPSATRKAAKRSPAPPPPKPPCPWKRAKCSFKRPKAG